MDSGMNQPCSSSHLVVLLWSLSPLHVLSGPQIPRRAPKSQFLCRTEPHGYVVFHNNMGKAKFLALQVWLANSSGYT